MAVTVKLFGGPLVRRELTEPLPCLSYGAIAGYAMQLID
jgi:hypothetical protein